MEYLNNDHEFQNYVVKRALPMMLQNNDWRNFLIDNAIHFIGVHNLNTVHQEYIVNPPHMDITPPMELMFVHELGTPASSSAITDSEHTPNGGKRRKRTRKRRKRRKNRQ